MGGGGARARTSSPAQTHTQKHTLPLKKKNSNAVATSAAELILEVGLGVGLPPFIPTGGNYTNVSDWQCNTGPSTAYYAVFDVCLAQKRLKNLDPVPSSTVELISIAQSNGINMTSGDELRRAVLLWFGTTETQYADYVALTGW